MSKRDASREFRVGLARAFGGSFLFSLPLLMTMEMWSLGFTMDRLRLALFLVSSFPLLVGLSFFAGFEETFSWRNDLLDAFVAFAVGFVSSALFLFLLAVVRPGMSIDEIIGKVSLQTVPGAIGALLARSQLGSDRSRKKRSRRETYRSEMFLMTAGAFFVTFNIAPTEDVTFIAAQITPWLAIGIFLVSMAVLHGFVYAMEFEGQSPVHPDTPAWSLLVRFTSAGYVIALLVSLYMLWTFGRLEGLSFPSAFMLTIVLALPASLGAAAARLIL